MDVDSGWCADFPCSPATTLDEDDIFGAAEDGCHLDSWIGGQRRRPIDPPKTIERLGELMSLLGPRYKTLPREKLWEKAASGDLTAFQRRALQAKGHGAAVAGAVGGDGVAEHHNGDGGRSRGGAGAGVSGSPSKREAVDADPDGNARAAWLAARTHEKTRRDRPLDASPAGAASCLSLAAVGEDSPSHGSPVSGRVPSVMRPLIPTPVGVP